MGGACSMGIVEFIQVVGGETSERAPLEDPGVYGRIILRWIFSKLDVGTWTGGHL
jgi:hypothetical protein